MRMKVNPVTVAKAVRSKVADPINGAIRLAHKVNARSRAPGSLLRYRARSAE